MPRQARDKGEFSIYHVIQRGNEKKSIFLSDEDRSRFIEILVNMKKKYNFLLYAYCLMDNHVHLIIDDNGNDISKIVTSINISYAQYFNRIYSRCGHLFQDRFKSEMVNNDAYLFELSRYIHNNPVKAGIVKKPQEYLWSSFNIYTGRKKDYCGLIDKGRILDGFSSNKIKAVKGYIEFMSKEEDKNIRIMDIDDPFSDTDYNSDFICTMEQARLRIREVAENKEIQSGDLKNYLVFRNELISRIRRNSSLSLKQIGELFGGLSVSRVSRILAEERQANREPSPFA